MGTTKPVLVKIQHKEFNVEQFINADNKVYRIYELKNGVILGIKDMQTKVIHPLTDAFYYDLYNLVKGNFFRQKEGNRFFSKLNHLTNPTEVH
jgi:hypothetical protein